MESNENARSWNDPPQLGFTEAAGQRTKRNLLTKRVPFPLSELPQSTKQQSFPVGEQKCDIDAVKIFNTEKITFAPDIKENADVDKNVKEESSHSSLNINESDEEILAFVTTTLKNILLENAEKCETMKEIDHRLDIMQRSWNSTISKEVKNMMFKLAKELSRGNVDAASKVHCILIVEHVREVKQWMVGVKHIIEIEKQKQNLQS
ncbi:steroid receptor RNA activator 1-like isoform X1 [Stegodyphus dumicola]|uniref:steroid receptor RNA activator 1-like isoform X1 n=1 Tax=Stegodyphus dumicola TaxID=202533 RepID=UPI0015ABE083|nr:steroid receptor RNA activator 1-like isoform X1 [Stegodyphus dumicola]